MVKNGEKSQLGFIGIYERKVEERGRLAIPVKFRQLLEEGAVLTRGLDNCLFLFPASVWQEISHKLRQTPLTSNDARAFTRLLTYEAFQVEFDSQGRILVPEILKKFCGMISEAVIAGSLDRVEIWDKQRFVDYQSKIEKSSDEIAERLSNLEIRI